MNDNELIAAQANKINQLQAENTELSNTILQLEKDRDNLYDSAMESLEEIERLKAAIKKARAKLVYKSIGTAKTFLPREEAMSILEQALAAQPQKGE